MLWNNLHTKTLGLRKKTRGNFYYLFPRKITKRRHVSPSPGELRHGNRGPNRHGRHFVSTTKRAIRPIGRWLTKINGEFWCHVEKCHLTFVQNCSHFAAIAQWLPVWFKTNNYLHETAFTPSPVSHFYGTANWITLVHFGVPV